MRIVSRPARGELADCPKSNSAAPETATSGAPALVRCKLTSFFSMRTVQSPLERQMLPLQSMDIARPDLKRKKMRQYAVWAGVAVVVLTVGVLGVARLKPAAPTVDRSTIWAGTGKRGPMIGQARGAGR